ncbi:hypothetical protein VTO73DRAFT_7154 [Trametes versicolor]
MANIEPDDILLNIPIYIQTPPHDGGTRNRHVLICVRLLRVDADNVRVETVWNSLQCPTSDTIGEPSVHIPRRQGVQAFIPPDPFRMPIYVVITRRNRYGTSFHVGTALQLYERLAGAIGVTIQHLRVRRRNIFHSSALRIVRGGSEVYGTEQHDAEDGCDAEAGDVADSSDIVE